MIGIITKNGRKVSACWMCRTFNSCVKSKLHGNTMLIRRFEQKVCFILAFEGLNCWMMYLFCSVNGWCGNERKWHGWWSWFKGWKRPENWRQCMILWCSFGGLTPESSSLGIFLVDVLILISTMGANLLPIWSVIIINFSYNRNVLYSIWLCNLSLNPIWNQDICIFICIFK